MKRATLKPKHELYKLPFIVALPWKSPISEVAKNLTSNTLFMLIKLTYTVLHKNT